MDTRPVLIVFYLGFIQERFDEPACFFLWNSMAQYSRSLLVYRGVTGLAQEGALPSIQIVESNQQPSSYRTRLLFYSLQAQGFIILFSVCKSLHFVFTVDVPYIHRLTSLTKLRINNSVSIGVFFFHNQTHHLYIDLSAKEITDVEKETGAADPPLLT